MVWSSLFISILAYSWDLKEYLTENWPLISIAVELQERQVIMIRRESFKLEYFQERCFSLSATCWVVNRTSTLYRFWLKRWFRWLSPSFEPWNLFRLLLSGRLRSLRGVENSMWRLLLRIRNFLPSPAGTLNLCFPISILFEIFKLFRNIGTEKTPMLIPYLKKYNHQTTVCFC